MGYYGKIEVKLQAVKLRGEGKSYNEIIKILHLSKSTVSDWCKDVPLTSAQIEHLYRSKRSGALKGSYIAARNKINKRKKLTSLLFNTGKKEIGKLTKRERFIAGVAYYSSEGTKTDNGCALANSDPYIIKFMIRWFKEFAMVSNEKFRAGIWIHNTSDEKSAKLYWSSVTKIPENQFYKSYIVSRDKEKSVQRKKIHPYGICTIYVSDVTLGRRIKGWIGGILKKPMV